MKNVADNPIKLRSFEPMIPLTSNQYINEERIERAWNETKREKSQTLKWVFPWNSIYNDTIDWGKFFLMRMPIVCHYIFNHKMKYKTNVIFVDIKLINNINALSLIIKSYFEYTLL